MKIPNIENDSLSDINVSMKEMIKANNLELNDFIKPAYEYYKQHNSIKAFQALLFNEFNKDVLALQMSHFIANQNDVSCLEKLITTQTVSLAVAIKGSIMTKNHTLTEYLFNKDYFLSSQDLDSIYFTALSFDNTDNIDLIDKLYQKNNYKLPFNYQDQFSTEASIIEACVQGQYPSNLDYITQKHKLEFKYKDLGISKLIMDNLFVDSFYIKPVEKQIQTMNELNHFFHNEPDIIEYYFKGVKKIENYLPPMMEGIHFFLENNWTTKEECKETIHQVYEDIYYAENILDYYEIKFKIEKEKTHLENTLSTTKIGSKVKL